MQWIPLAAAVALLLAGCSDAAPQDDAAGVDFSDLDLSASATTGIIRGVVVDDAIRPLAGADITVNPGGLTTRSDDNGRFGFDGLAAGVYFLSATRLGFDSMQSSVDVVAGVSEPAILRILLTALPGTEPYVEALTFNGFLTFGAAIFATSVGTTIYAPLSEALSDTSIWAVNFTTEPDWLQGELVWEHNQAAGGELIWEMTRGCSNTHAGYRETTSSPALAYWNTTTIRDLNATNVDDDLDYDLLEDGLCYRFFGGPHPLCKTPDDLPQRTFGCGLTVQQRADVYAHHFYNFVPDLAWRFTLDGAPLVPQ